MTCRVCGGPVPAGACSCPDCGSPHAGPRPGPGSEPERRPGPGSEPERRPAGPGFALSVAGRSIPLAGHGVIGRNPAAGDDPDSRPVVVEDPGRSLSKTHFEFAVESGRLWIADLGSSNGTAVRLPGGRLTSCEPGRRYPVPAGAVIEAGNLDFAVEAAQQPAGAAA